MGLFDIFKINRSHDKANNMNTIVNAPHPDLMNYSNYSTAVFLNAYKKSEILQDRNYYRYIYTECGISKPSKFHKKLIDQGYLVSDDNILFHLSNKGKQYLKENEECTLVHKYHSKWDIDWQRYIKNKKRLPFKSSFYDVMWSIFLERQVKKNNTDIITYRHMYELLNIEKKYSDALKMLLKYYYLSFNNIDYYAIYMDYKKGNYQEMFRTGIMSKKDVLSFNFNISKYDINALKKLSEYLTEELIKRVYNEFYFYPLKICSEQDFTRYLKQIINNEFVYEKTYVELNNKWQKLLLTL